MQKPAIKRYLSENIFLNVKKDFQFLVKKVIQSGFEYDLQIRDNYLNLYYKGNSLGKISYNPKLQMYRIEIHHKFINEAIKRRFQPTGDTRLVFTIPNKKLHPLFSSANLTSMAQRVKDVNYQEETTFEQMLMTDNVNRNDLIIIDRQIADSISSTKMDLLALAKKGNADYQFCIIEVKLGNNPELKVDVIKQLNGYKKRISDNFVNYKKCYEINLKQKQEMGLIENSIKVNIVPDVLGIVVVGGYSGIAKEHIKQLKEQDPSIKILQFKNTIDISKAV
jgi:hypothetical protein